MFTKILNVFDVTFLYLFSGIRFTILVPVNSETISSFFFSSGEGRQVTIGEIMGVFYNSKLRETMVNNFSPEFSLTLIQVHVSQLTHEHPNISFSASNQIRLLHFTFYYALSSRAIIELIAFTNEKKIFLIQGGRSLSLTFNKKPINIHEYVSTNLLYPMEKHKLT